MSGGKASAFAESWSEAEQILSGARRAFAPVAAAKDEGTQRPGIFQRPARCLLNERWIRIGATGFGSGLAPLAPGTAGTLVGIPLYLLFSVLPWPIWLITILAFTCLAWHISDEAERLFGRKDAQCIVIDEIAGLQWTLFWVEPTALHVILGFLLFRLFDIVKPFPARLFQERLPGGCGVVADDLAAGVYGSLALQILILGFGI